MEKPDTQVQERMAKQRVLLVLMEEKSTAKQIAVAVGSPRA